MALNPSYTFEVVAYTENDLIDNPTPDTRENLIQALNNRTVWIKTVQLPLKHGDQFTRQGQEAYYLKKLYVDVTEPLLKIVE